MTSNVFVLVLLLSSEATQTTVFVPNANAEPDGWSTIRLTLVSQPSKAVTVKLTTVPGPPSHSTTILLGQMICGGVVSMMVMVWLPVLVLPQASSASQVRVAANVSPTSGLVTVVRTEMSTLVAPMSVALGGVKSHIPPHSTL